jgi:hypothetical protein
MSTATSFWYQAAGLNAVGPFVTAAEVVAVTGRSRRRAYELLRDARTEQG